jgi:hypothetical protein
MKDMNSWLMFSTHEGFRIVLTAGCISVSIVLIVSMIGVSRVHALDICSLVSRAEMSAVTGKAIASVEPMGPGRDQENGAVAWNCLYNEGESVVTVIEFPSAGAAQTYVTPENLRKELQGLEIDVMEEKGLGDRAFVLTQEEGWTFSLLKGSKYLAVTVSGALSSGERVKASLRQLAAGVAAKL